MPADVDQTEEFHVTNLMSSITFKQPIQMNYPANRLAIIGSVFYMKKCFDWFNNTITDKNSEQVTTETTEF